MSNSREKSQGEQRLRTGNTGFWSYQSWWHSFSTFSHSLYLSLSPTSLFPHSLFPHSLFPHSLFPSSPFLNRWQKTYYFILEYLLEPFVVTLIWELYLPHTNLLVRLFTQDNLFSSLRYLLTSLGFEPRSTDQNYLPKWTYFLTMTGFYWLLHLLTWGNYPQAYCYYLILFSGSPAVVEFILEQNLTLLSQIESLRRRFTNYLVCLALSRTINFICIRNLKMDPEIKTEELQQTLLIQDPKYVKAFMKVFVITSIIKYLKTYKKYRFYGWMIKMLYEWGTIIELPKNHRSMIVDAKALHPRETISEIIQGRKWNYFYDPTVLNLILRIYDEQDGDFLSQCIQDLYQRTLRFMTIWSLARFIPIPILALTFRLRGSFPRNLIIPMADTILLFCYPQRLILISLFSEFGGYLNNPVTRHLLSKTKYYTQIVWRGLTRVSKYNFYLVLSIPVVHQLARSNVQFLLFLLPFYTKYNFIYIWLVFFGYFSRYSLDHLIVLNAILYLSVNLYQWSQYRESPQLSINMIESYRRDD